MANVTAHRAESPEAVGNQSRHVALGDPAEIDDAVVTSGLGLDRGALDPISGDHEVHAARPLRPVHRCEHGVDALPAGQGAEENDVGAGDRKTNEDARAE